MNERLQKAIKHFELGTIHSDKGMHDRAIADFDEAIRLKPDFAEAYHGRGIAYFNKGEHDHAVENYNKAIDLDPDYAEAYNNCGIAYFSKGEHNHAVENYNKAIDLDSGYAKAYNNRGVAYSSSGEYEHAIEDYDKAIELKPDYAEAYNNRGVAYSSNGEYEHAIEDYDKAIELKPDYAEAYNNRGIAYSENGRHDRAIADFGEAIKLKPKYAGAYNNRGIAYSENGRHDRAIADFGEAIKLKPDYAGAYSNRGIAYSRKGEYDHAIEDYDKAIELKPDYAVAYFNRGIAHNNSGKDGETTTDYDKAIELKPDYAVAYCNRGMIHFRKGKHDRAIADFLKAGKIDTIMKSEFPFVYLAVRIRDIFEEKNVEVFELYGKLLSAVLKIQNDLFHKLPKDADSERFAHYTSLNALKSLTSKDSKNDEGCFRLYNVAYMNDPEEGRVFFDIIKEDGRLEDIEDVLYANDEGRSPTYIGSFIKIDKNKEDKDQLFLWRTYGKQDGQEAAGSCLIYKRVCFAERYPSQIGAMPQLQARHDEQQRDKVRGSKKRQNMKPPLYNIRYYSMKNQQNGKRNEWQDKEIEDLSGELKEITNALKEIVEFINKRRSEKRKNGLKELACELLDSVRFLFKASHYSEEHEVRIIRTYYGQEDGEQELNPIKVDAKQIPPRFYLETSRNFSFDEVILGPMVQRVPEWKRWIKQQKTAVKVRKSKIKYGKIH